MDRQSSFSKRSRVLQPKVDHISNLPITTTAVPFLSDKTVFVIPVGHSMSLKLQGMLHENARKSGVRIADKAKEADIFVAVHDVQVTAVRSYFSGSIPNRTLADLTWLRAVLGGKVWINPVDPKWLWKGVDQSVLLRSENNCQGNLNQQKGSVSSLSPTEIECWIPRDFPTEYRKNAIALLELIRFGSDSCSIPVRHRANHI